MKLAYASAANARVQMRERQRRDRLATPALRTRFPQFSSVRFDFEFSDSGPFTPAPLATVMHPPACAYFFFPCPYADCDGEFNLTAPVAELAKEDDAHRDGHLKCSGHRTGDKGRVPCQLTVEYHIEAQRG
jgi:hypothetical protein